MSDGKWSGGIANRNWARPGSRVQLPDDPERAGRLTEDLADAVFLDEVCGRTHPLREHRLCREKP